MQKKDNSKPSMDKNERKRGRPAGKNRVPLSLAERRARNAQYERERRNETTEAMADLAEAACCDRQISNPDLLATVISRLQQNEKSPSIDDLKRINNDLEYQIAVLQNRLESGEILEIPSKERTRSDGQTTSNSNSDSGSGKNRRPTKYRKTSKEGKVHENARRISSSSHPESSADSQDSDWSNHHLGKTLPQGSQYLQPNATNEHSSRTSSRSEWTNSESSDCREPISIQSGLALKNEYYSENFEQCDAFSENSNQQDVTVEIQLLPELSQLKTECAEEPNTFSSMDPFTDGAMAMLDDLGWGDFLNFQDAYSENQSDLRWPLDYAGF